MSKLPKNIEHHIKNIIKTKGFTEDVKPILGLVNIFYPNDVEKVVGETYTKLCSEWAKNIDLENIKALRKQLQLKRMVLVERVVALPEPGDKRAILDKVKTVQDKYVECKKELQELQKMVAPYAKGLPLSTNDERVTFAQALVGFYDDSVKVLRDTGKWHKSYAMQIYKVVGSINKSDINRRLGTIWKRLMHPFKCVEIDGDFKSWIAATKKYLEKNTFIMDDLDELLNGFSSTSIDDDKMVQNFDQDFTAGRNTLSAFCQEQISRKIPWTHGSMMGVLCELETHFMESAKAPAMFGAMDLLYEQVGKICDQLKQSIYARKIFTKSTVASMVVSVAFGILATITGGVVGWIISTIKLIVESKDLVSAIK